ncbi:hypothetical protein [Aeromonas phage 4L372XY]|uniref:Uncharacterized protein n=1 Tax=Aeromonas phage 4L372XY TaxID=2588520 RepID=A0A5B9N3K0_9CAUD|nr:hypothetical protein HWC28_gp012 [Aeromonas phage 4L372XY]QEG08727.1 hypothetical protein [Aeromonas phage 4L372XY]
MKSIREILAAQYVEFLNDYLTVAKFAEHKGLTGDQARQLIELAKSVYYSKHPEA